MTPRRNVHSRRAVLARTLGLGAGLVAAGGLSACTGTADRNADPDPTTERRRTTLTDPETIARDAFLAGIPLLTTVRTMKTFAQLFGVNRLFAGRTLASPTSRLVVAPNRDTLYALAVFDLRAGPQLLTLPDITDRYHVFQFLDAWMGGFGLVGTRTTEGRSGSWAIVPPGDTGAIPDGAHRLEAPTNQAIMLGRIRAIDEADAVVAAARAREVRLEPLAPTTSLATPPVADMPAPVGSPQTAGEDGVASFDELADAVAVNPPVTDRQRAAIDALSEARSTGAVTPDDLARGVAAGRRELERPTGVGTRRVNGWDVNVVLGEAGDHETLRQRAVIARYFWGPVPAHEAVYPRAVSDRDGRPLDGTKRYRIHFAKNRLPPVDGFWSVTAYGPDMFLVPNAANRYSVSGETPGLETNADGSIDLLLQHDPPHGSEANWLPVPRGAFNVMLRLYLPRAPILDGTYEYPPVISVGEHRAHPGPSASDPRS